MLQPLSPVRCTHKEKIHIKNEITFFKIPKKSALQKFYQRGEQQRMFPTDF